MAIYKNDINKHLRWYITQPDSERVAVHTEKTVRIRAIMHEKRKSGAVDVKASGEIDYQAFCEALRKRYNLHNSKLDNRQDLKAIEAVRINVLKDTRKIKSSKIRDKITNDLYLTIKVLRKEGLSWEKIAKYIAKHKKRKISVAYLHRIFTEIESEAVDKE